MRPARPYGHLAALNQRGAPSTIRCRWLALRPSHATRKPLSSGCGKFTAAG